MMWGGAQYDEDLNHNRFLQDIQRNHQELLWKCCREPGWVILVPRHDTVACEALQRANMVLDHVMVEDQDGAGGKTNKDGASADFYVTLSRKRVQLIGRQLRVVGSPQCTADVLFAETFYMTGSGNNAGNNIDNNVGNNSKNTGKNIENNSSNKNKNASNNIENIPGNNSKNASNNIENSLSNNSKNAGNNIDNILGNISDNTSDNIENIPGNNSKNAGNNIDNILGNISENTSNNIENILSNNSKNAGNNIENNPGNNTKNAGNNIENISGNSSKNASNNIENNLSNNSKNVGNNIDNILGNSSKNAGNNIEINPSNNSKNAGNNNKILCNKTKQSKYVVWCISRPLLPRIVDDWHHWHVPNSALESVHDCVDFLWIESEGHAIFERLNAPIDEFARHWPDLQLWRESVAVQRDLIASLYTKCLQVALRDDRLCQKGDASAAFLRNLKLAVETHVQHQLGCHGNQLIMSIGAILCVRDATFNKIVLNMRSDRLTSDSRHDSLSMARQSLTKINNHLTVLDKLNCLKKTFNCLTAAGSCQTALTLTCDETLQHFVNLILTSNVNNWVTNLTFLKEFRFSCQNDSDSKSEDAYVIATLEAAIEYIKNLSKSVKAPLTQLNDCQMSVNNDKIQNKAGESQNYIDNQLTISGELTEAVSVESTELAELCHPLCVCNKCAARIPPQLLQQPDDDLMSACQRGDAALVEKLMRGSVIAPLIDDPAPLLCAAAAGHQDVLLLLLNCYANNSKNINEARDVHGNTVLHLTALNGHDSCVKAVVYTVKDLDINARNRLGETALFLAARWGYIDIINVLLQNGADVNLTNSRGQGAKEVAPNYEILSLLCTDYDSVTRSNHYCKVSVNVPTEHAAVTDNVSYGVRPKNSSQFKKVDLLLKAIANDDVPLACFYLGFKLTESVPVNCTKCHPLCTCNSCCGNNSKNEREDAFESGSINGAINVNICNGNGLTPLHIAAKYGRKDILRLLLDAGANSNVQTYKTHFTPLIFATINGHVNVVRELLNCGECEVDKCDSQGHAALYYACMKNDYKLVEVLVNNGADCAIRNAKTGRTLIQELTDKGGGSATSQKIYEVILKRKRTLVSAERGKKDWLG